MREYNGIIDENVMTKEELKIIIEQIKSLSYGIDPLSGIKYPDDSVLNNQSNRDLFKKVVLLLEEINLRNSNVTIKKCFYLSDEKRNEISLSDEPVSISALVHSINQVHSEGNIRKLKATEVTSWLESKGYLSEIHNSDGYYYRTLTEKSYNIGLEIKHKRNKYGREYSVIMYNINAQKYIIDNLNEISDYILLKLYKA